MRLFALFLFVLVGCGVLTHANEGSNLRKLQEDGDLCDLNNLNFVFLLMEDENFKLTFIPEGLVVCLSSVQVSFLVIYGRCNRRGSKINRVVIEHFVNGKSESKKTERQWPYFLYGDIFKPESDMDYDNNSTGFRDAIKINFRDAVEGNNTITARANRGATKVINFTVKKCP